jgi:hypothetical protein
MSHRRDATGAYANIYGFLGVDADRAVGVYTPTARVGCQDGGVRGRRTYV